MTRMTTIARFALCASLLASVAGCASMYGKGKDSDANRVSAIPTTVDANASTTR